jgi:hypothetical protein
MSLAIDGLSRNVGATVDLTLVGYFLKGTSARSGGDWWPPSVVEICSVSECLNPPPQGWIERWLHNDFGFFNSRNVARTIFGEPPQGYSLFGYRLLPVCFDEERRETFTIPQLVVEPLSDRFVSLGFDVTSKSDSHFECSPLSCNGFANKMPVNRLCLLDTRPEAESFAERCAREEPEPGQYFVVEVLREES